MPAKLYPNSCVKRILAGIPDGHMHLRLVIELCDQAIVLHEATVAAIVRAYASVALHPKRRAIELRSRRMSKDERKPLFAEHQLLETDQIESSLITELEKILRDAELVRCGCAEPADADR
ncbi:MAG: hypothetical protein GXO32_08085 [Crenarchaeota archaeon]|nr:hypothetical protein [Thermoproteota archaeon]